MHKYKRFLGEKGLTRMDLYMGQKKLNKRPLCL